MSAAEVASALFAAYNTGDMETVGRLYEEEAVHTEVADQRSKSGRQSICDGLRFLVSAFPDADWHVVDVIADGDRAAVSYNLTGALAVKLGPYTPHGQRLSLDGVMLIHTSGAQITRSADYWDAGTFAKQMSSGAPTVPAKVERVESRD